MIKQNNKIEWPKCIIRIDKVTNTWNYHMVIRNQEKNQTYSRCEYINQPTQQTCL